jgi:DNA-binding CsgD family transcriptional regulator/tetratricopeptide (TPR) repeat protein
VLAWTARATALRGHYRDAVAAAREALEIGEANAAGPHVISQARNTLGMALAGCGLVEVGLVELRESLALAQRAGDVYGTFYAYGNLSDLLFIAGRTREGLAVAQEGLAAVSPSLRSYHVWLAAGVAEIAFAAGEWELAARSLDIGGRAVEGRWLINLRLRAAELALGTGQLEAAERALDEIAELVRQAIEPQFHAGFGLALADLRRRRGDLEGARGALQDALDRIEVCTDDAMRVAAIGAAGVAVEADIAQRARDRDDGEALRSVLLEAEIHLSRVRAAAESAGPVEAVWVLTAEAEMARADGGNDPALWDRAAAGWEAHERAYLAARARWRQAEACVERGDRTGGAQVLAVALGCARALGSHWLVAELEGLSARARLRPSPDGDGGDAAADVDRAGGRGGAETVLDDPFGLTPRERQVLALVARGATNREIGAELFMAEKTASVHVSRILAKLDVRSRTQAAAVAHRAGLVAPDVTR